MQEFIGTGVALITPFKKDLSVDFLALAKLQEKVLLFQKKKDEKLLKL